MVSEVSLPLLDTDENNQATCSSGSVSVRGSLGPCCYSFAVDIFGLVVGNGAAISAVSKEKDHKVLHFVSCLHMDTALYRRT